MPMLVVKYKDGTRAYPLQEGVPVFVGRARECDIHLPAPGVSRRHAVIMYKNGICGVKDLGSFNGTLLNDVEITQPCHLTDSDILKISSFTIRLESRENVTVPAPPSSSAPASEEDGGADATAASFPGQKPDHSELRLPRAMAGTKVESNVAKGAPGSDSAPEQITGGEKMADSTIELPRPADYAASLAADAQAALEAMLPDDDFPAAESEAPPQKETSPVDTDYFRLPEPDNEMPTVPDMASARPNTPGASGNASPAHGVDAETVIPFEEKPESAPLLSLDWDDEATNLALEQLVADLPSRDVSFLNIGGHAGKTAETEKPPSEPESGRNEDAIGVEMDAAWQDEPEATVEPDADTVMNVADTSAYDPIAESASVSDDETSDIIAAASVSGRPPPDLKGKTGHPGVDALPIHPALMAAINSRLSLYSSLFDLSEERRLYRMGNPDMPPEVAEELNRQDAEVDTLPTADEADDAIQATRSAQEAFDEAADRAQRQGTPPPEPPSLPRGVEEMAITQWRLIRDANRELLPPVFKEAYRLAADEELARELSAARINHGRLLGGAVYLLALEALADSAQSGKGGISISLRQQTEEETAEKRKGLLGRLGQAVNKLKNRDVVREATERQDRVDRLQLGMAAREYVFMEKHLVQEFRQVYAQVAIRFIPGQTPMPMAVRAFLRYGAIGFKSWWMPEALRESIIRDCSDNIAPSFEVGPEVTNILYADEYLTAVANMECAPFPDESLNELGRNSVEWKTERLSPHCQFPHLQYPAGRHAAGSGSAAAGFRRRNGGSGRAHDRTQGEAVRLPQGQHVRSADRAPGGGHPQDKSGKAYQAH